jgi:hypothetical protein
VCDHVERYNLLSQFKLAHDNWDSDVANVLNALLQFSCLKRLIARLLDMGRFALEFPEARMIVVEPALVNLA